MALRSRWLRVGPLAAATAAAVAFAPPAPATEGANPVKAVLLGDSYSAGNGAFDASGQFVPEPGPERCLRTKDGWFGQYMNALNAKGFNRACSGAVMSQITAPSKEEVLGFPDHCPESKGEESYRRIADASPPREPQPVPTPLYVHCGYSIEKQVKFVDSDTDLVMMTIGGDDLDFDTVVRQCFGFVNTDRCKAAVEAGKAKLASDGFKSELARTISAIKAAGSGGPKDVKVVFLSYPYLVGSDDAKINGYSVGREIREAQRALDGVQFDALKSVYPDAVKASGCATGAACVGMSHAFYVDTVKAKFAGHEPNPNRFVSNPDSWFHELLFPCWPTMEPHCYHPNPGGHTAIKNLLVEYGVFGAGGHPSQAHGSIDVVLVIDTTGSMSGDINAVKSFASGFVEGLSTGSKSYRVGLVSYRDLPERSRSPGDYASRVLLGFTGDKAAILAGISAIDLGYGGDAPETVYSGLMAAVRLPWRVGVKKVILQFGDAPPLDPEPVTGFTADDVVSAARAVDPAVVYGVDVSSSGDETGPAMRAVASGTGGRVLKSPSPAQVQDVLTGIVKEASSAPLAWAGGPYTARVGVPVTLDGGASFDDGTITAYEWDFDGNGVYETTTHSAQISHTFATEFTGTVAMRVTDDKGLKSEAMSDIVVSRDGDLVPAGRDNCPDVENESQQDFDADGIGDACDPSPGYSEKTAAASSVRGPGDTWVAVGVLVLIVAGIVVTTVVSRRPRTPVFCDQCGERYARSARFCDRCGEKVPSA
ncbi:MAG: PKD domain-containing protein [Acidimicrobiales bacterium]